MLIQCNEAKSVKIPEVMVFPRTIKCPICYSSSVDAAIADSVLTIECLKCGHGWKTCKM